MATITIKIESEELAREVLTQLGYLPSDDVPDLISDESDDEPEVPKEKEPIFFTKTTSSRDAFAEQQIKKVLVNQGLLPPVPEEVWCPEPNDEGFGTPIDHTMEKFDVVNSESLKMLEAALEKKKNTQKNYLKVAASMKEQLTPGQYMQFLEAHESDPNIDPDLKQVAYQLILHEKAKAQDEATKEAALKDEGYRNYIENVEPISYEDYLK